MKGKKIGTLFMVSILALAGVGISYAGWNETLSVTGTVQSADVSFDITEYSGTWVYKMPNHGREIVSSYYTDMDNTHTPPTDFVELVASSWAEPGGEDCDVKFTFGNLYPLVEFKADFKFTIGSIPVHLTTDPFASIEWTEGSDFIQELIDHPDGYVTIEILDEDDNVIWPIPETATTSVIENDDIIQLHQWETYQWVLKIFIPQDNNKFMNEYAEAEMTMDISQWNWEDCDDDEPDLIMLVARKIILDSIDCLPKWGQSSTYPEIITSVVIDDFLDGLSEDCTYQEVDWDFQWADGDIVENDPITDYSDISSQYGEVLDHNNEPCVNWHTFTGTTTINRESVGDELRIREVLQEDYIPFAGDTSTWPTEGSAELYAHRDGYKFDNFDFIVLEEDVDTYYIVGFNVKIDDTPAPTSSITVDKDTIPAGSDVSFDFTVKNETDVEIAGFSLTHDTDPFVVSDLELGIYTVTEILPDGWEMYDVQVTNNIGSISTTDNSVTFEIGEDPVTVKFTNFWEKPVSVPETMHVSLNYPEPDSYWGVDINTRTPESSDYNYPINEDDYILKGWCVDINHGIYSGWSGTVRVHYDGENNQISREDLWDGQGNEPDGVSSWDCVDYILNHKGSYDSDVIQYAIWFFVNGGINPGGDAGVLIQSTLDNVVDWVNQGRPVDGHLWVAVLLDPNPENHHYRQLIIIEVDP